VTGRVIAARLGAGDRWFYDISWDPLPVHAGAAWADPDDPEETWHNWPLANHRMAAALAAKGYDYRFTLSRGGRHADPRVLDHTLPDALTWLWQEDQP
jgi:hypothetical protein